MMSGIEKTTTFTTRVLAARTHCSWIHGVLASPLNSPPNRMAEGVPQAT